MPEETERADAGTESANFTEGDVGRASEGSSAMIASLERQFVVPQACAPVG